MTQKTFHPSFDQPVGLATDYALIATSFAAVLFALVYLILI